MNTLATLNPQQQEAALHKDGPLLILAGAGSGKTATMTHRIAHLIENEGVNPWNILAVTFTNKAAGEMRERVRKLIGEDKGDAVWLMTFHAVCLRILRMHADKLGYSKSFAVYDPQDQKAAIKRCIKELSLDPKRWTPSYALSQISKFKEDAKTPAQVFETAASGFAPTLKELAPLYERYAKMLKDSNAMDFDDLLLLTVQLFKKNTDVLEEYRKRWRYVMVDEYQDTNKLQYTFISLLAAKHRNICVVGDDDQCIYQWRGADISNILGFERDFPGAKIIRLEQNYRSTGHILNGANSVIRENRARKEKSLWTDKGDGEKVVYKIVYDERDEAAFVADEALRLREGGKNLRDIAVLTRTNAQSRTFEEAFIARGIEYQMLGQIRYYDRKEIKDMLSYMSLVQNPADNNAFLRIANEPRRGLGDKGAEALTEAAARYGVPILALLENKNAGWQSLVSSKAAAALGELATALKEFGAVYTQMKVSELYDELLEKTGYLKALEEKNTVEDDARVENLLEFRSAILESEAENEELTLAEFLEKIALMADIDNHDKNADAIVCMTLHSAKGLEFPVVFIPGMEEGLFPSLRSMDEEKGVEEERRLCYVGMTRAMEKLYLLRARERTLYGKRDRTIESRFLHEIDATVLDENGDKPGGDVTGYLHDDAWGERFGRRDGHHGAGYGGRGGYGNRESFGGIPGGSVSRNFNLFEDIARNTPPPRPKIELTQGDRVKHTKFGEGIVLSADENVADIMFDEAGKKKLALDVAPLEKLS